MSEPTVEAALRQTRSRILANVGRYGWAVAALDDIEAALAALRSRGSSDTRLTETLADAVLRYGTHIARCPKVSMGRMRQDCTCGFADAYAAALAAARADTEQEQT